jgi:hypothetical protein
MSPSPSADVEHADSNEFPNAVTMRMQRFTSRAS